MNKYFETLSKIQEANKPVENNTELEKVEFAMDDYDFFASKLKDVLKNVKKAAQRAEEAHGQLTKLRGVARELAFSGNTFVKDAEKQLAKDMKAAKNLGVDPTPFNKEFKKVVKVQEQVDKVINDLLRKLKR